MDHVRFVLPKGSKGLAWATRLVLAPSILATASTQLPAEIVPKTSVDLPPIRFVFVATVSLSTVSDTISNSLLIVAKALESVRLVSLDFKINHRWTGYFSV